MLNISYNGVDKLDGIFNYFNRIGKTHYFEVKGTKANEINVKEPEFVTKRNQPQQYYWASDRIDEFITFSFKNLIKLTRYSLTNAADPGLHSYPEEFALYGSNDYNVWHIIDNQTDQHFCNSDQCSQSTTLDYLVDKNMFWRHFKIQNIKNSNYQDGYLILRSVEFFGIIYPAGWLTNVKHINILLSVISLIIVLTPK